VLLAIAIGAAVGTVARDQVIQAWGDHRIAWGVVAVNGVGTAILAILVTLVAEGRLSVRAADATVRPLLGIGFCGGLTTFSTCMIDAVVLVDGGSAGTAALNLGVELASGLATALVAIVVTRAVCARPVAHDSQAP
jgi:CrcB protein